MKKIYSIITNGCIEVSEDFDSNENNIYKLDEKVLKAILKDIENDLTGKGNNVSILTLKSIKE